jgi:hypothetical protein
MTRAGPGSTIRRAAPLEHLHCGQNRCKWISKLVREHREDTILLNVRLPELRVHVLQAGRRVSNLCPSLVTLALGFEHLAAD